MRNPCLLLSFVLFSMSALVFGQDRVIKNAQGQSVAPDLTVYTVMNVNNFIIWQRRDGYSCHTPTGGAGGYYPRSTTTAIYLDNFVWGAKAFIDSGRTIPALVLAPYLPGVRIGGGTYNHGLRAGALVERGATASPEPDGPSVRIYRIRRDFIVMDQTEYHREAEDLFQTTSEAVTSEMVMMIREQYQRDWDEWPVEKGAPYIERNGIPGFQRPPLSVLSTGPAGLIAGNYDEPGISGIDATSPAEQVIWIVANDYTTSVVHGLYGSYPIGIEVQKTIWTYRNASALSDIVFCRLRMINKGGAVTTGLNTRGELFLDSMFIALWSDLDIGDSGDDLIGCDVNLDLAFGYNSQRIDAAYDKFQLDPPSIGYVLLQGPRVDSPGDTAQFDFRPFPGAKNLGMTSFSPKCTGSSSGEPDFTAEGGMRMWRWLRGFLPDTYTQPLRLYPHPPGVPESLFPLSGDPVMGTGFVDGLGTNYSLGAGDRRFLLNSGPFRLCPGDTQEVIIATVAGLGSDRLSSVALMKANAGVARGAYRFGLAGIGMPESPSVQVSEFDRRVVLNWGNDQAQVGRLERAVGPYAFEGYRVYQLPDRRSSKAEAALVLDVDVKNIYGDNTGIVRSAVFDRDFLMKETYLDRRLKNGQEYYLAVTAYRRSADGSTLPNETESPIVTFTVIPQRSKPGEQIPKHYGDTVSVNHVAGHASARVEVKVVDPLRLVGRDYEIRIAAPDSTDWNFAEGTVRAANHRWFVCNKTTGDTITALNSSFEITDANPTIDGLRIGLDGIASLVVFPEIASVQAPPSLWGVNWGGQAFMRGIDVGVRFFGSALRPWEVARDVEIRFNSGTMQNAYVFRRLVNSSDTRSAQYQGFFPQPFTVWDVTDPQGHRQLDFAFVEMHPQTTTTPYTRFRGNRVWDIGIQNDREYFFISGNSYSGATQYDFAVGTTIFDSAFGATHPVLYGGWLRLADTSASPYIDGDVLSISSATARVVTTSDVWSFSTQGLERTIDSEKAKLDVQRINVAPNPLYAQNPAAVNQPLFVTFNGLPTSAVIRIFNVAGQAVRTLRKEDDSQFLRWDLRNERGLAVASGIYIAHIDMSALGTKILKLAIIQEERVP